MPQKSFQVKEAGLIEYVLLDVRWRKGHILIRGGPFKEVPESHMKLEKEVAEFDQANDWRMKAYLEQETRT